MIKAVIITGILFVIGNATHQIFDEQKVFYVPQALFFIALLHHAKANTHKKAIVSHFFLNYLLLLSVGNLIKQIFYSDILKQINDYIWAGFVTLHLIFNLIKWAIKTNQHSGMK